MVANCLDVRASTEGICADRHRAAVRNLAHRVFAALISTGAGLRGAVNLRAARFPLSTPTKPNLAGAMALRMQVFPDPIAMDAILETTHFASQKDFRVRNFHIPVWADARRADATTPAALVFPARDLPVRIRAKARN